MNDLIRKSPIRLIDEDNEMLGIVETQDALERAREAGLDLVEVAADSDPPVCRILDYGKFRYEQSKKDKANKARSKSADMKEVRLGRSMKIDPHDIQIRLNQARKFLMDGHKVQIVQNFRGREMVHRDRGSRRMQSIIELLSDISKVEMSPRQAGRRMTMMLAPDKAKIERVKRRDLSLRQNEAAAGEAGKPDSAKADSGKKGAKGKGESDAEPTAKSAGEKAPKKADAAAKPTPPPEPVEAHNP